MKDALKQKYVNKWKEPNNKQDVINGFLKYNSNIKSVDSGDIFKENETGSNCYYSLPIS